MCVIATGTCSPMHSPLSLSLSLCSYKTGADPRQKPPEQLYRAHRAHSEGGRVQGDPRGRRAQDCTGHRREGMCVCVCVLMCVCVNACLCVCVCDSMYVLTGFYPYLNTPPHPTGD
jgi:hypothetical protein